MISGIYKITNIINNKYYIGSSSNIKKRWKIHRYHANKGDHHSIHFQRAWSKYGKDNFIFEIIEELDNDHDLLLEVEQKYLDELTPWNNKIGYNISQIASGGDLISNHPNKEEIAKRRAEGHKRYIESLTEQDRHDKFARYGKDNPNWRGGLKTKICPVCKREEIPIHNKTCKYCTNTGERNAFYNQNHSEKTKQKLSEIRKKQGNSTNIQKIEVEIDGVTYSSMSVAAKEIGCAVATIRNRIENPKFPNYILKQP